MTAKPSKKAATKPKSQTGAPAANFLKVLTVPPSVPLLIGHTRRQREFLSKQSTKEIMERMWLELWELAERTTKIRTVNAKPENAAVDLARVATVAADILEELAATSANVEITAAAARKNRWPVNLRLGKKGRKVVLVGGDKAKSYLTGIKLGQCPPRPLKSLQNPDASPFSKAAELLYGAMLDWRDQGAWRGGVTEWAEKLLALDVPINSRNVDEWWSVAKTWMDEQWEANHDFFHPLIKHLGLNRRALYQSEVKRRVIDDSLKKAFKALPAAFVES
ncbi:MAG: hypothetical protein WCH99_15925 [Verrucomicrobiota bacterium]